MSGGLLGFGDPAADQKTADDYGVTPEMLSAQRYASLGNIGAILLAAAQPGPIGQRGQIMAKLADVSGSAASGLKDAVAARMNGIKLKEAQADLARKQQLREMVANDTTLTPEQKTWAIANPEGYFQARGQSQLNVQAAKDQQTALMPGQLELERQRGGIQTQQAKDQQTALMPGQLELERQRGGIQTENEIARRKAIAPIETQQEIEKRNALLPGELEKQKQLAIVQSQAPYEAKKAALVASGMDEPRASGLASGRYVLKDQEDDFGNKTQVLFDLATGQPVGGAQPRASLTTDQQKIVSSMPTTGADGKAPIDYSEATGGAGGAKNWWNIVSSNLTGQPTFADANLARKGLEQLQARTETALTADVPGRPTNAMREQLNKGGFSVGSIAQPDAMAFDAMSQRKAMIDASITRQEAQLQEPGYSRSDRSKIRSNLVDLKQLQADYGTVLTHFGNAGVAQQKPPAVGGTGGGGQGGPTFKILGVRDR